MAALTRSPARADARSSRPSRAIRDEAIRAAARGVTEITGGPRHGKTVVALHRAAYLLYSERRRYESGGILVVGPSGAYTAYIERVLPSLGEESVTLRAVGEIVDAVDTERLDPPEVARIKGSTRIRTVLGKAARGRVPGAPTEFRAFVAGRAVRLEADPRPRAVAGAQAAPAQPRDRGCPGGHGRRQPVIARHHRRPRRQGRVPRQVGGPPRRRGVHGGWWPQVDPREVLAGSRPDLWRHGRGVLDDRAVDLLAASFRHSPRGRDLVGRRRRPHRRPVRQGSARSQAPREERGSTRSRSSRTSASTASPRCSPSRPPADPRRGRPGGPA